MIKALFFDIDGTLVSFKTHRIPTSTIQALEAAKARGVRIFIATGRPQVIINNLNELQQRGLIDGYITMNGAYCFVQDKVIYKSPIPKSEIETLLNFCEAQGKAYLVVGENDICVCHEDEEVRFIFYETLSVDKIREVTLEEALALPSIYQITPFIRRGCYPAATAPLRVWALVSHLCRHHRRWQHQATRHRRDNPPLRLKDRRSNGLWRWR